VEKNYTGMRGLPMPYRADENYRKTIDGDLLIDYNCFKKEPEERLKLKILKAEEKRNKK
jgi:hypothetical protein